MENNELVVLENNIDTIVNNEVLVFDEAFTNAYVELLEVEAKIKDLKKKVNDYLLNQMEENNMLKLEHKGLSIFYVSPTYRENFDKETFEKENPELYKKYLEISNVKSSIRAKIKNK